MNRQKLESLRSQAREARKWILKMAYHSGINSHFGGGLSLVDILTVLYDGALRYKAEEPAWEDRDRLILSKGHGVLGYYAALKNAGFLTEEDLRQFQGNESPLSSHPVMNLGLGIESSNGSLGHGLSLAVGSLLAARIKKKDYRAFVIMGNGECNEGSVWEAAMSAVQFGLGGLVAIIDDNGLQSDGESRQIMDLSNLEQRFQAFGWTTAAVDGHDLEALYDCLSDLGQDGKPKAVIAKTIKGKGISFMESNNDWHHNRLNEKQYLQAISELGGEE